MLINRDLKLTLHESIADRSKGFMIHQKIPFCTVNQSQGEKLYQLMGCLGAIAAFFKRQGVTQKNILDVHGVLLIPQ